MHLRFQIMSRWWFVAALPCAAALSVAPCARPHPMARHHPMMLTQDSQLVEVAKTRLLAACQAAAGGRDVERRASVLACIEEVEALNPTPQPLACPKLLSGCWRLVYTTSDSILGTARQRPFKPDYTRILQSIDAEKLAAKNEEWVLGGLLKNQVRAELTPREDGKTVDVQFKRFGIGWLRVPAPASARGVLETTFLDDSLRISRGDKGNLFCLVRVGASRV